MIDRQGRKHVFVPKAELWNTKTEQFEYRPELHLCLEHSLYSISLWESKWKVPFSLGSNTSDEQLLDYIRCMDINGVDLVDLKYMPQETMREIAEFINDTRTATFFSDKEKKPHNQRPVTSELVYYWMFQLNIPMECEHWHFNRLMTLIHVCNEESKPQEKKTMSRSEIADRRALNRMRAQQFKNGG